MGDRLPRLTADHSVGAPISRDDLWWLITQVYQLRASHRPPEGSWSVTFTGTRCAEESRYVPGSRCALVKDHDGPHCYGDDVQEVPDPLAEVAPQCTAGKTLADGGTRCAYSLDHPGPHSFEEAARCTAFRDDPWFTRCVFDAGHIGTHSYEHHVQCIPRGTHGLRECTYEPGHRSPHSFEAAAMGIKPATSSPRTCNRRLRYPNVSLGCDLEYGHTGSCQFQNAGPRCSSRRDGSRCQHPRGHYGPCAYETTDGDHEDTYQ